MRVGMNSVLALVLLVYVHSSAHSQDAPSPQNALREWAKAFGSANVGTMTEFYEDSKDVVVILSSGHMLKGTTAVRTMYEEAFDGVDFEVVSLDSLIVRQAGDVAWATCRFKADTVRSGDKSRWELDIHTSFVMRRFGDSWKITLEHSSPIVGVPRVQRRK